MKISSLCTGLLLLLGMAGATSAAPVECVATAGSNCPARIADAPQDALVSTITLPDVTCAGSARPELSIAVDITHSGVGDLGISVTNPAVDSATLLSNQQGISGACRGSDVNATFHDGEAAAGCRFLIPSVAGATAPVTPLAPLITTSTAGPWTLTVADSSNNGDGALNDWSVDVVCVQVGVPPRPAPISWQALAALATLLAFVAFVAMRRRGGIAR